MAIRKFCDVCDKNITAEKEFKFDSLDTKKKVTLSVKTDTGTDWSICNACILKAAITFEAANAIPT